MVRVEIDHEPTDYELAIGFPVATEEECLKAARKQCALELKRERRFHRHPTFWNYMRLHPIGSTLYCIVLILVLIYAVQALL